MNEEAYAASARPVRHRIWYQDNLMYPPSYKCGCLCGWEMGDEGEWLRDYKKVEAAGRKHLHEVS